MGFYLSLALCRLTACTELLSPAQVLHDNLWSHINTSELFTLSGGGGAVIRLSSKFIHRYLGIILGLWGWRVVFIRRILSPNVPL